MKKYATRRISLADDSLILRAEMYEEARIATFESDFTVYTWGRTKRFDVP